MAPFIDITNREKLNLLLRRLQPETPPAWGKLNAQRMIEHLIEAVEYTNGKKTTQLKISLKEASIEKQLAVRSDFVIPKGVEGYLSHTTKKFKDLPTAVNALNNEIDAFELFFKTEGRTAIHPAFGSMNYKEWIMWHGKHFAHHFMQFGLQDS